MDHIHRNRSLDGRLPTRHDVHDSFPRETATPARRPQSRTHAPGYFNRRATHPARKALWLDQALKSNRFKGFSSGEMGWETGIEPATAGATVQCSAS